MSETDDGASSAPDKPAQSPRDYVFRFRVDPSGEEPDLLDAVVLTDHGRRVRVDGFRLLQEPETQYEIFPQSAEAHKEDRGQ